jgi:segregation and condensation protein A
MTSTDYRIKLPVFEGPLDLLLSLIEREELDITTIALAQVTDQYLAYLADLQQRQARQLADFLVVAAKLLVIKSRALLPPPVEESPDVEDVGEDLVYQLKIYKRFKQIAQMFQEREAAGLHGYVRIAPLPVLDPQLDLEGTTLQDLLLLIQEALDAVPAPPVDEVITPVTVTVGEQLALIQGQLRARGRISFREVLSRAASRIEIIVTLLAVLELVKQDQARIHQERLFGEILIERPTATPAGDAGAPDARSTA